jgi:excisionase family DNA binding protein
MRKRKYVILPVSVRELEEIIRKCLRGINHQPETKEEFLTIKEAAEFLKVSSVSIHNWKREKNLPFYRLGRSIRFKKQDLIEFGESQPKRTNYNK